MKHFIKKSLLIVVFFLHIGCWASAQSPNQARECGFEKRNAELRKKNSEFSMRTNLLMRQLGTSVPADSILRIPVCGSHSAFG